jgi:hypothetical protein
MITVVSGLPRSGTSMMMQMLEAGGMPVLVDDLRPRDDDNPRGYYEYEPVKRLQRDNSWLDAAEGKAVKVVSPLLNCLPLELEYRVVLMVRDLDEVVLSQEQMLKRAGAPPGPDSSTMRRHFEGHLSRTRQWLSSQRRLRFIECRYADVLEQPAREVDRIAQFLEFDFDRPAMIQVVQPELRRQHSP